jgi:hypothetical protein
LVRDVFARLPSVASSLGEVAAAPLASPVASAVDAEGGGWASAVQAAGAALHSLCAATAIAHARLTTLPAAAPGFGQLVDTITSTLVAPLATVAAATAPTTAAAAAMLAFRPGGSDGAASTLARELAAPHYACLFPAAVVVSQRLHERAVMEHAAGRHRGHDALDGQRVEWHNRLLHVAAQVGQEMAKCNTDGTAALRLLCASIFPRLLPALAFSLLPAAAFEGSEEAAEGATRSAAAAAGLGSPTAHALLRAHAGSPSEGGGGGGGGTTLRAALQTALRLKYAVPQRHTPAGIKLYRALWFYLSLAGLADGSTLPAPTAGHALSPAATLRAVRALALYTPALVVSTHRAEGGWWGC